MPVREIVRDEYLLDIDLVSDKNRENKCSKQRKEIIMQKPLL